MRTKALKKTQGMTLLEVMVAMAIFATAAIAITKSLASMMNNLPILESRTLAQWVANNQMVDARLVEGFPALGKKQGKTELAEQTWYWRLEVIKTTNDDFRMLRISVSDDENFKQIQAEVSSYVAKK